MNCFVIMPFGDPATDPDRAKRFDLIYSQWIKPTVEGVQIEQGKCIRCHRADKDTRPDDIVTHIIENLVTADIVIADLSGRNANVFYELGVRHAVSNNTILISDNVMDIPFDLRGQRAISYRYEPEHMLLLKESLDAAIRAVVNNPEKIDNPVRRYLYETQVRELVARSTPPGYDVLGEVLGEIASLRKEIDLHRHDVRQFTELVTRAGTHQVVTASDRSHRLERFVGMWETNEGSLLCARVIEDDLRVPYCYHGRDRLTAHYYSCSLIDETLYAKFEWFNSAIAGYGFLRTEKADQLVGGWWYAEDVPREVRQDISKLRLSNDGMYPTRWTRVKGRTKFPAWAEDYFSMLRSASLPPGGHSSHRVK